MISFIMLGTLRKGRNYTCLQILSTKNSFKWVQEICVKWGRMLLKRVNLSISNESKKNKAKKMKKEKLGMIPNRRDCFLPSKLRDF